MAITAKTMGVPRVEHCYVFTTIVIKHMYVPPEGSFYFFMCIECQKFTWTVIYMRIVTKMGAILRKVRHFDGKLSLGFENCNRKKW